MAIQPETVAGRKAYWRKKREDIAASWVEDENGVIHIPFDNGMEALFDKCHFSLVSQFKWYLDKNVKKHVIKWYVGAFPVEELRPIYGYRTLLHRVIIGNPKGMQIDHENGDGLDCRDKNLRLATHGQNSTYRKFSNSTGFRGVVSQKSTLHPYYARIGKNGEEIRLGYFPTATGAAQAYDKAAIDIFGAFAVINGV